VTDSNEREKTPSNRPGELVEKRGVDPNTVIAGVAAVGVAAGGVGQLIGALKKPSGSSKQGESTSQAPPSKPE
jgi:hypothetical protein